MEILQQMEQQVVDNKKASIFGHRRKPLFFPPIHEVVEILPVGGRCVLFDSRVILHEVKPNVRTDVERLAVTCWLRSMLVALPLRRWSRTSLPRSLLASLPRRPRRSSSKDKLLSLLISRLAVSPHQFSSRTMRLRSLRKLAVSHVRLQRMHHRLE